MKTLLLKNSKGISVLFLVIAMLLMVTIGYVLSYIIPTKQKSVAFPIYSNQAFFIAQSGVEFAVRYATDLNWTTTTLLNNLNGITRNLGSGRFTLTYTNTILTPDTLTSVGEVPLGTERRRISVSNFTSFVAQELVLWIEPGVYQEPCYPGSNTTIRFYIKNIGSLAITLTAFSASWSTPPTNRRLNTITIGTNTVFSGVYNSGSGLRDFTPSGNSQTINSGQVISVLVTWDRNISPNTPVNISFYNSTGTEYPFTLAPIQNCTY